MRASLIPALFVGLTACATTSRLQPSENVASPAAAPVGGDTVVNFLPRRGQTVRVLYPDSGVQPRPLRTGSFQRLAGDTLMLERQVGERLERRTIVDSVTLKSGRRLQVLLRSRGHSLLGFGVGFLVGAIPGAIAGENSGGGLVLSRGGAAALGAAAGGLAGGLVGALVGYGVRTEQWATVDIGSTSVRVTPGGLSVRFRF